MKKLLFHPKVTLAASIAAFTSGAAGFTAMIAAFAPLLKIEPLKPLFPYIVRIDGDLAVAAAVCSAAAGVLGVIAGMGRSFNSAIDAGTVTVDGKVLADVVKSYQGESK